MMTPEMIEQLRINLLNQADAASQIGLTDSAYFQGARTQGYKVDLEAVKTEIDYLVDKELMARVPKAISPNLRKNRITAAGRDWLAEHA